MEEQLDQQKLQPDFQESQIDTQQQNSNSQDQQRQTESNMNQSQDGQVRKSARFIEQEEIQKSNSKNSKRFVDTIKFDASLYQSADDESEDDNDAANNNNGTQQNRNEEYDIDQARKERSTKKDRKQKPRNLQKKEIAPSINKNQSLIEDIQRREQEASKSRKFINIKVDPCCEISKVQVVDDYSCYLQQSDIAYNEKEATKFYKMQLLVRDDQKKWSLWVQQGRVGYEQTAPTRVTDYYNRYDGIVEFELKFIDKTGNKWQDREFFQQKPGKHILIKREHDKELVKKMRENEKLILEIIQESRSKYAIQKVQDHSIRQLVEMAWNFDLMKKIKEEMSLDVERLPMGKLQKDSVVKAYKILREISKVIIQQKKIKEKIKILESLQHIANAENLMINSETAFENTQAEAHLSLNLKLRGIYTTKKLSEQLRFIPFEKQLHNKFLLWHGVKQVNLASNLREGLKMPVNEAPSTTYMFGKGIYFTDSSSKAARESVLTGTKVGDGFLFLCEVALGDMHKAFQPNNFNKPPNYHHSVYGVGLQKPKLIGIKDLKSEDQDSFMPSELTICSPQALFLNTGKLVPNPDLQENKGSNKIDHKLNDYIVYDEAQVKISYLVHFTYDLTSM
ncbi:poly [Stylonychia lemnae]|uniref:Poly [ADP-ribose] polymerase n=1 Tax=Stylonychia lemnae TaxID=5949 RepID=A0A077ZVP2_STYLE|nr:poly [Stylonychia lemnae]|eukprot:CDW73944.1 poly [Stylonychia lemnae]